MRDLKIKPALNGYICLAGCQTLVFTNAETMLAEIGRYLKNPGDVEKEYIANAVNKTDGLPLQAEARETISDGSIPRAAAYGDSDNRLEARTSAFVAAYGNNGMTLAEPCDTVCANSATEYPQPGRMLGGVGQAISR